MKTIQKTCSCKAVGIARIIIALPLLGIGAQHLLGTAPLKPILEAVNMPMADLNAVLAPILQVVAGALLISGFFARIGALLAIATMLGALYAHFTLDPVAHPEIAANLPPVFLPILIAVLSIALLIKGAGAFSLDRKLTSGCCSGGSCDIPS